jgi:hypothetical protein
VTVDARGAFDHLSVAAMLIPTNDGFFAVNGEWHGRAARRAVQLHPGPSFAECGGPGGGAAVDGGEEGYVHIHRGIHGVGDFVASERDWRNPVARIVVRRVK